MCLFLAGSLPSLLLAWEGKVVSVTDGDTIKVLKDGKQVKIRLAAIDCPEKGQPWSLRAKHFTAYMVIYRLLYPLLTVRLMWFN